MSSSTCDYDFEVRWESQNGRQAACSIRTPGLKAINNFSTNEEIKKALETSAVADGIVPEDVFYRLVAFLAPIQEEFKSEQSKLSSAFRKRCDPKHHHYFTEQDLDSEYLEEPNRCKDYERIWMVRYHPRQEDAIHACLHTKIAEFQSQHHN